MPLHFSTVLSRKRIASFSHPYLDLDPSTVLLAGDLEIWQLTPEPKYLNPGTILLTFGWQIYLAFSRESGQISLRISQCYGSDCLQDERMDGEEYGGVLQKWEALFLRDCNITQETVPMFPDQRIYEIWEDEDSEEATGFWQNNWDGRHVIQPRQPINGISCERVEAISDLLGVGRDHYEEWYPYAFTVLDYFTKPILPMSHVEFIDVARHTLRKVCPNAIFYRSNYPIAQTNDALCCHEQNDFLKCHRPKPFAQCRDRLVKQRGMKRVGDALSPANPSKKAKLLSFPTSDRV